MVSAVLVVVVVVVVLSVMALAAVESVCNMQCTSPVYLKDYDLIVPCRKCRACHIARVREWTVRLVHESVFHKHSCFLTLTYSPENLPQSGVQKRDLQLFLKRLRARISVKIKYFACGEYGDQTFRPHYHAIIFGLPISSRDIISDSWSLGLCHVGSVTVDSCQYVSGYIHKKQYGPDTDYTRFGVNPPFQLQSQGIGLKYALENSEQLKDRLHIVFKENKLSLPAYYVRKLDIDKEKLSKRAIEYNEKARQKIFSLRKKGVLRKFLKQCEIRIPDYHSFALQHDILPQINRTLISKESLFKRQKI